ncbi:MAG: type II secretion system F family protein [Betaproteobacteria bacterium]|jgi:type IV pilus assembly protein PilC|nr:MAG: type II secretion system F family protein [Betaproteobacteria bacterium]
MPSFQYKAIDRNGRKTRGRLDAYNEIDLELRLRKMRLDLITARLLAQDAPAVGSSNITRQDLITFCFDMEQISRAGIPIVEGLRDLRDGLQNPRFREVLTSALEDIEGGKTLSEALAAFPKVFNKIFISLIRAGELTGELTEVFENLGTTLRWQDELVAQTRKLLIYPALVFLVVGSVVIFLLMYLVPQVVGLLTTMGIDLPLQTRVLIKLSELTSDYWYLLLFVPLLIIGGGAIAIKSSSRLRYAFDYFLLRLPVVGQILQKILLARFANFFALMYRSGITILDAIRTSEDIVANGYVADGLRRAGQQINAGENLSEAFKNLGMFPPLVVRMLRVGENTGALDTALMNVTYFYNRDVKDSVDKALKLLEPTLTLLLGIILALILFSVFTPVYEVLGQLDI